MNESSPTAPAKRLVKLVVIDVFFFDVVVEQRGVLLDVDTPQKERNMTKK
jgi:hypothetical protein